MMIDITIYLLPYSFSKYISHHCGFIPNELTGILEATLYVWIARDVQLSTHGIASAAME
jgi:hypothetical protein